MGQGGTGRTWDLLGGRPCLDFVNTLNARTEPAQVETLTGYGDLVDWSGQAGLLDGAEAVRLLGSAAAAPASAAAALAEAVALRESVAALLTDLMAGRPPASGPLADLDRHLGRALDHRRLVPGDGRLRHEWDGAEDLERPLWPLALDAEDLLTGPLIAQVRRCAGADCGWMFLDLSRNRSRRWCSMTTCGNLAKVHRFRRRTKMAERP